MEVARILTRMTGSGQAALDLLRRDHAAFSELFDSYGSLEGQDEKEALVNHIIRGLTVHARIEEEIFYPALRRVIGEHEAMDLADVQHALIRRLMADLNDSGADAPHFDAKVRALGELVTRHAHEEEAAIFDLARDSDLDLSALGGQLQAYRSALESRYELDTDGRELASFLSAETVVGRPSSSNARRRGSGKSARRGRGMRRSLRPNGLVEKSS
jgi:hemerythrin superfamily protein